MQNTAPYYPPATTSATTAVATPTQTPLSSFDWLKNKKTVAIAMGFLLLGVLLTRSPLFRQTRVVTTTGTAKVTFVPNKVVMTIMYSNTNGDQNSLLNESENEFENLKTELQSLGALEFASVSPQIRPIEDDFQYARGLRFTLQDMNSVPQVTSTLNNRNIVILQTRYFPEDEQIVNRELMDKALENARDKAIEIARAANSGVGRVISISEVSNINTNTGSVVTVTETTPSLDQESRALLEAAELTTTVNVTYALTSFPSLF